MTIDKIIILSFIASWMIIGFICFFAIKCYLRPEFKGFYMHPIVGALKDIYTDNAFTKIDRIFVTVGLSLIYLPITCEWFIAWCLYKFWKFIYIDDSMEQRAEEEIKELDNEYQKRIQEGVRALDESINNPEAMSNIDDNRIHNLEEI